MAGAALVSAAVAVGGAVSQANAAEEAGDNAKAAAEAQADIAEFSAQDSQARANIDAARHRIEGTRTQAAQRAAFAASGVDLSSGLIQNITKETAVMSEMDALITKNNAAREAWGLKMDAQNLRKTGQYAQEVASAQATGSLLTGAAGAVNAIGTAAMVLRK